MPLTQQRFLGASIRSFNCQVGWNGEASSLNVDLAVDSTNSDTYPAAIIGGPAYFSFLNEDSTHTFKFGGIIQSFAANGGVDGLPLYSVTVKSPTDILDMCRLILNSYNGSVAGIPNIFNIYGYLENSLGFGGAGVNSYGTPYISVFQGLTDLVNGVGSALYGGPGISYRGYSYIVDLSRLPVPPPDYRISGDNVSLLEVINQLCEDAGCDYFVSMFYNGFNNVIQVTPVSRAYQPTIGQVASFINTTTGVNAKSFGTELRNEDTSVFLMGGKKTDLYNITQKVYLQQYGELNLDQISTPFTVLTYQDRNGEKILIQDGSIVNGVWTDALGIPYTFSRNGDGIWYNDLGNLIYYTIKFEPEEAGVKCTILREQYIAFQDGTFQRISSETIGYFEIADEYDAVGSDILQFWGYGADNQPLIDPRGDYLDSSSWDVVSVGQYYLFTIGELRAALTDQDTWENYLVNKAQFGREYKAGRIAPLSAFDKEACEFALDIVTNLNLEADLGLKPGQLGQINSIEDIANKLINTTDFLNQNGDRLARAAEMGLTDTVSNISKLYNYVRGFAEEYYGKQFLVRIPNFQYKYDSTEDRFTFSHEITDAAYLVESGSLLGLPSEQYFKFQQEDGRFGALIRFQNEQHLDYFNLNSEYYTTTQNSIYLKCDVEQEPVFYRDATVVSGAFDYSGPYVPFAHCKISDRLFYLDNYEELIERYADDVVSLARLEGLVNPVTNLPWTVQEVENSVLAKFWKKDKFGAVHNMIAPVSPLPNGAVIPFISNTERYGPWYNVGAIGKTRLETDDNLVPWNFGGFTQMNQAALSKVAYSTTQLQISEHGELTLPGSPRFNLGDILVAGGPNITSINTSFGGDGVKTTYSLRTFTPKIKIYDKTISDRFNEVTNLAKHAIKSAKETQTKRAALSKAAARGNTRWATDTAILAAKTPHNLIGSTRVPFNTTIPFESNSLTLQSGISSDIMVLNSGNTTNRVATARYQEVANILQANSPEYKYRCLSSMDTLYSIFSTDPFNSGLPRFISGSGEGTVNRGNLNPFKVGQQYEFLTWGDTYPESGLKTGASYFEENKVRGIGWRLPAIGVGWGFDLSDNPVPADTGNPSAFAAGYLSDASLWKAGPIDLRWDAERGVWAAKTSSVDPYVVIAHSGYFRDAELDMDARPRYIVRKIDNIRATGCGLVYTNPSVLSALVPSGTVVDRIVFNLQENYGDLHTVGLGSPVLLYNKFGQYFFNELPRTFARTDHY